MAAAKFKMAAKVFFAYNFFNIQGSEKQILSAYSSAWNASKRILIVQLL